MTADPRGGARRRGPALVAFLSFLWPGLGHAALGRARTAVVYGVPLALIAVAVLVQIVNDGPEGVALTLLTPSVALTVVILAVLVGLWRVAAIVDSVAVAGGRVALRRAPIIALVALLTAGVGVTHGVVGWYAWSFYEAGTHIFVADPGPDASGTPPDRTPGPATTADPSDDWVATPAVTPPTTASRINVLLTGIDSSTIRRHELTDTLIVVSIDPEARTVAMVSFPRDIARFRLSDGRLFTGKINSLMSYANRHREEFPAGGLPTLRSELGHLLGIPIHYYAAVNLDGFVKMIDAVGGVTVTNERRIADPTYGGWTDGRRVGFFLPKGRHTLDGQEALAYVRSRRGAGDNDFTRARRQQQLLVALSHKMSDPAMLPKLPALLGAASETIKTDFPPDRAHEMLDLARAIDDTAVERVVLGPPYAARGPSTDGVYRLQLDMDKVAALSVRLFDGDSAYASTAGE